MTSKLEIHQPTAFMLKASLSIIFVIICCACAMGKDSSAQDTLSPTLANVSQEPSNGNRTEISPTSVPISANSITPTPIAVPTDTPNEEYPDAQEIQIKSADVMEKISSYQFNMEAQIEMDDESLPLSFEGYFKAPDNTDGKIYIGPDTTDRIMIRGNTRHIETSDDPIVGSIPFILSPNQIIQGTLSKNSDLTLVEKTILYTTPVYRLQGTADKSEFTNGAGNFTVEVWIDSSNYRALLIVLVGSVNLGTNGDPSIGNLARGTVPIDLTLALSEFGKEIPLEPERNPSSISVSRTDHTATTLHDGRILIVGGFRNLSHLGMITEAEIYDPSSDTWTLISSMLIGHLGHSATLLNDGNVLVIGPEWGGGGHLRRIVDLYNTSSGKWSSAGETIQQTFHTASLLNDGGVLIAGGWLEFWNASRASVIYEPSSQKWFSSAKMNQPRAVHTATLLNNGKILVTGGAGGMTKPALSSAELFDYQEETWKIAASMENERSLSTATLLKSGKVLIVGGHDSEGIPIPSAEIYDPENDNWSTVSDMNESRVFHTATLLNDGRVLIMGGSPQPLAKDRWLNVFDARLGILRKGETLASVEIFDPVSETWTNLEDMEMARQSHTATLLDDGKILVVAGTTAEGELSSFFELYSVTDNDKIDPSE